MKRELGKADLTVVNLEAVLSHKGEYCCLHQAGRAYLRGRPELVGVLNRAGVDLVSVANNHAGDFGIEGLNETVRTLENANISPMGAGKNRRAAAAPVYRKLGDLVVAFIGVSTTRKSYGATENRAGINYVNPLDLDKAVRRIKRQVKRARRFAHLVIPVIHLYGASSGPDERQRLFAERLVREAGIDALLGSHSHKLQGIEVIQGRPIVYDAGNLIQDQV